jgi:LysM repeat protein
MRFIFAMLCTVFSFGAFASVFRDSIGVENKNGNQLILHKVTAKETYYSIGRLYQVSPRTIIEENNNVPLQIGVIVKIPTTRSFAQPVSGSRPTSVSAASNPSTAIIEYKVGPKEYLYAIARKFDTTIDDIKALNNLRSNSLSIGQTIKVRPGANALSTGNVSPQANTVPESPASNTPAATLPAETPEVSTIEKPKLATGRLGVTERSEKGVAVWIADENLDGTKMLALHRTAPVGTVVKVTNPMTDRVTFVKVVGKFTENESNRDAVIVITKATADLLGALDKRFLVTIDYGVPNE